MMTSPYGRKHPPWWGLVCLGVVLTTALSLWMTGFKFGINNNIYHIPYVLQWSQWPVFQGDAFYQSLEKFTSVVWLLIRQVSNEQNIELIFFVSHVLSRGAAFIALCWFFYVNGASNKRLLWISLGVVAVCPWLIGVSLIGIHGLFIDYFTHSETTWGPLIAAVVCAQLGRLRWAAFFVALVFSINAFIGVWIVVILALTVLSDAKQRSHWALLASSFGIFLLMITPVTAWISLTIAHNTTIPVFDYSEYIRTFFPNHFLIESSSVFRRIGIVFIAYFGILAAFLSEQRLFWLRFIFACIALWLIGAIAPYILNHRFVFNLHLLRADGILQFFTIILTCSVFARFFLNHQQPTAMRVVAMLGLSLLVTAKAHPAYLVFLAVCLSFLAIARFIERQKIMDAAALVIFLIALVSDFFVMGFSVDWCVRYTVLTVMVGVVFYEKKQAKPKSIIVLALCFLFLSQFMVAHHERAKISNLAEKNNLIKAAYFELTAWVRQSALKGPFLIPVDEERKSMFGHFSLQTQKTVWVDWKQGAAAMWEPSFYWHWMPRFKQVKALRSADDWQTYAIENKIPYLILLKELGACTRAEQTLFHNAVFSVCAMQ